MVDESELRGLLHNYRSTANVFPEGSEGHRVASHCAEKLEELIDDE